MNGFGVELYNHFIVIIISAYRTSKYLFNSVYLHKKHRWVLHFLLLLRYDTINKKEITKRLVRYMSSELILTNFKLTTLLFLLLFVFSYLTYFDVKFNFKLSANDVTITLNNQIMMTSVT